MNDVQAVPRHDPAGKSITITLPIDDENYELFLLARFLDDMTVEAVTRHALTLYLTELRDRFDYKAALDLKKHHERVSHA